MLSTAASLASPFHSRGLPRRRPVGGSRWSGHCRTCSTPRGCPPGSPRSPRRPPAPRASPCWEGTAPLWACRSSAASEVQGPAASPGSLWWRSTGGGRVAHIRLDSHKAAAASLPPSACFCIFGIPAVDKRVGSNLSGDLSLPPSAIVENRAQQSLHCSTQ